MRITLDRSTFLWTGAAVCAAILPLAPSLPLWLSLYVLTLGIVGVGYGRHGRTLPAAIRLPLTLASAGLVLYAFSFRFGRDTGAALLASMLALKLLETPSVRDARSVLSFACFAVLAGFFQDQSPLTLLLALFATTLLLMALARIAERETPASGQALGPLRWRESATRTGKLVLISAPLAAVLFLLFPRLATPLWGIPDNAESRTGLSDEMTPGDIAKLFTDDSPALRVSFPAGAPEQTEMYWRGPVLTRFDGRTWTRTRGLSGLGPAKVDYPEGPLDYEVEQEPTDRPFLITLDLARTIPPGSEMTREGTVLLDRPQSDVIRFRAQSALGYTLEPELDRTYRWFTSVLPEGFNPRTRTLVEGWKRENPAPDSLIQRSLAMFSREFAYSFEPGLLGRDSVDDFLFNTREGYCEHFASAFVVMMRMGGIPARVVTGYQGGSFNALGDYWIVRKSDAHAWAEVWLEGRGWVRVDPTSVVAPARLAQGTEGISGQPGIWQELLQPVRLAGDWVRRGWNDLVLGFNAARQRDLISMLGLDRHSTAAAGIVFTLVAGLAAASTLWLMLRRATPPLGPLERAYHRFVRRLARAGVRKRACEPASEFARRAGAALPASATALETLSQRYVLQRYAPPAACEHDTVTALCRELDRFRPAREPALVVPETPP